MSYWKSVGVPPSNKLNASPKSRIGNENPPSTVAICEPNAEAVPPSPAICVSTSVGSSNVAFPIVGASIAAPENE